MRSKQLFDHVVGISIHGGYFDFWGIVLTSSQCNFFFYSFCPKHTVGAMPSKAQFSTIFSFTITKCLNEIIKWSPICVCNALIEVGNSFTKPSPIYFSTVFI